MKKLRLLLTENCDRKCKGCCNKDWDLGALPVCQDYSPFDQVLITGGEPMIEYSRLIRCIHDIRSHSRADTQIIVYTANVKKVNNPLNVVILADGITLTLHTVKDIAHFKSFNKSLYELPKCFLNAKSFRLNVFKNVSLHPEFAKCDLSLWKVKSDMVWIKNAPLPDQEVLMRYEA